MLRAVARDAGRTNAVDALQRELELVVDGAARAGIADADLAQVVAVSGVAH